MNLLGRLGPALGGAVLLVTLWSCGTDAISPVETDLQGLDADAGKEMTEVLLQPEDTAGQDEVGWEDLPPEDIPNAGTDGGFDAADFGNPFGEWNKPCGANEDCESGFCIEVGEEESVCTITCVEECPKDWVCKGIQTGPDLTFICVPPQGKLCEPCETDIDCLFKGDMCVPVGQGGDFCLTDCSEGKSCPEHYTCTGIQLEGMDSPASLCFPDVESCICTWELDGTTEECSNSNEFGKCFGEKLCDGASGWTECDAATPAEETCDGTDEDCDGEVDEGMVPMPCIFENEFGTCKGTQVCGGVDGYVCDSPEPTEELCDGLDNDCDDLVDEDFDDSDFDGEADCVDLDDDGDGVMDASDNCLLVHNIGQADLDKDGQGDACDPDDDGDGVDDDEDNCPVIANDQSDMDGDGAGDVCDDDIDGDGTVNMWDCAPKNPQIFPGAFEECDGLDNNCNMFVDEGYADADGDNVADCTDPDDDNDGDPDETDCAPLDPTIGHGLVEECDGKDNDCNDVVDDGFPDTDGDLIADCVDQDSDDDGILNFQDNCLLVFNPDQVNSDNDSLGDACDPDDDNDGILDDGDGSGEIADDNCTGGETENCDDNCRTIPNQTQSDVDGDLKGDVCDMDADQDGFFNEFDCAPLVASIFPGADEVCNGLDDDCNVAIDEGFLDTDDDGVADCVDKDDDGDLDPDETDCGPLDPTIFNWAEETCDGVDNNCDGTADEGCPPVAVRLEQLETVLMGTSGKVKAEFYIGRPASRSMTGIESGYKIRLGYTE